MVRAAIRADGAALWQGERAAVGLTHISARRSADQFCPELHAARDDVDLAGRDLDPAKLGREEQAALLGNNKHFSVGVIEVFVLHSPGSEVEVRWHAGLGTGITCGADRPHPVTPSLFEGSMSEGQDGATREKLR